MTQQTPHPKTTVRLYNGSEADVGILVDRISSMHPAPTGHHEWCITTQMPANILADHLTAGMSDEAEIEISKIKLG